MQHKDLVFEARKTIKVITVKDEERVICSGEMGDVECCEKVANFTVSEVYAKKAQ